MLNDRIKKMKMLDELMMDHFQYLIKDVHLFLLFDR
jgi:hypothetical protein